MDELAREYVGKRPTIIHSIDDTHIITTYAGARKINIINTKFRTSLDIRSPAEINGAYLSQFQ